MPTVLIVDDNPQDAYLVRCALAGDGFQFLEARNGREALERAREHPVDLVISDILMPVMDGFSLCREWRAQPLRRESPFVFCTATYVDQKDEDLAYGMGADLFLVKPVEPALLRERVAEVMARGRSGRAARETPVENEVPLLQQYNAALIRKLEDKALELEKANHSLRQKDLALASSVSGILLAMPSGRITYANAAMARLCGRPPEALAGTEVTELFAEPGELARWLGAPEAGPLDAQLAPAGPGAEPVWVQVRGHAVVDGRLSKVGVMLSCLDVSEERRLRQQLARVQRLEALSLFAAGVAHDVNNLLTAMYVGLDLGTIEALPEGERTGDREIALAAYERAKELTQRLLRFSRGDPPRRQPVELPPLLDEAVSLALSGSSLRCEKRYAEALPPVLGDRGQLAQVFGNLLLNARQALPEGGTVTVSIEPVTLAAGPHLSIQVEDDGPGIAPEVLPHVFEPYFTTKPQGSGLGLATSQAIVQEHGGRIALSTREGVGATFEVLLPVSPQAAAPVRPAGPAEASAPTGRILVMDDQVALQALLQRGLERAGHSVVVVGNGEQALLEHGRARREGRPFDLALLDITVRGGMGGVEALARLRKEDPLLLAIATTGYADDARRDELLGQGFAQVLFKPFLLHELLGTVRAVLAPG